MRQADRGRASRLLQHDMTQLDRRSGSCTADSQIAEWGMISPTPTPTVYGHSFSSVFFSLSVVEGLRGPNALSNLDPFCCVRISSKASTTLIQDYLIRTNCSNESLRHYDPARQPN